MEQETGKKTLAADTARQFVITYKAPLLVAAVILIAVGIDYKFRSSDQDFYTRGITAMGSAKYDVAVKEFSRALRQNAADSASRFGLGWAYHNKGWVDEAAKQYEMAAKAATETLSASYFNLGVILQQKKRSDDAIAAYNKTLAVNPAAANANYNLAFLYSDKGLNELALTHFKKTLQSDPKNINAVYYAGLMSERLGKKDDAKRYYQSALALNPNFNWAKERLKALGG